MFHGCTSCTHPQWHVSAAHAPQAKAYLTAALRASAPLRIGGGPSRPLNHGYQTADWAAPGSGKQQQDGRRLAPAQLQLYAVTDAACDARQVRRRKREDDLADQPYATDEPVHTLNMSVRKVRVFTTLNACSSCCMQSTMLTRTPASAGPVLPAPALHRAAAAACSICMAGSPDMTPALQGRSTPEAVRDALAGGAGAVQLRLKDGDGGACLRQVRTVPPFRPLTPMLPTNPPAPF